VSKLQQLHQKKKPKLMVPQQLKARVQQQERSRKPQKSQLLSLRSKSSRLRLVRRREQPMWLSRLFPMRFPPT